MHDDWVNLPNGVKHYAPIIYYIFQEPILTYMNATIGRLDPLLQRVKLTEIQMWTRVEESLTDYL